VHTNSIPQKIGKKRNESIHPHSISENLVQEQKDKKCFRNTNILNDLPSFHNSSNLWLNTKHLRNFRSDDLSQDKSCKEIFASRTKRNSNKTFLKNILNTKFHLYSLKVSANAKIALRCFENFGGQMPPWLRACPVH